MGQRPNVHATAPIKPTGTPCLFAFGPTVLDSRQNYVRSLFTSLLANASLVALLLLSSCAAPPPSYAYVYLAYKGCEYRMYDPSAKAMRTWQVGAVPCCRLSLSVYYTPTAMIQGQGQLQKPLQCLPHTD